MATEFPIDPEFGRNIPGMSADDIEGQGMVENEDGSVDIELPELDESMIEELPDGSAVVQLDDFKGPEEDEDFYSNLADGVIDSQKLGSLAIKYLELIDKDKKLRVQARPGYRPRSGF